MPRGDSFGSIACAGRKSDMSVRVKLKNGLSPSFEKRFLKRVNKTKKCWIWIGPINNKGYGRITYGGMSTTGIAHRAAWIFFNEKRVPKGLNVLHGCDNPRCVNPKHLHLGTQKQNIREMCERNRGVIGEDHPLSRLSNLDVLKVKKLLKTNIYRRVIAKRFNVSTALIDRIAWGLIRKTK
jgi:hypothetical protein